MLLIKNLAKGKIPQALLEKAAALTLPPNYEVSLVFVDNKQARELNLAHRGKDYSANILSFPLSDTVGEIFLNVDQTEHDPLFLFIHGLLHLNGMTHGSKMEHEERKVLNELNGQKINHRPRRGHSLDQNRGNRTSKRQ